MPRYEYRCRACGTVFEEFRAMRAADAAATCPQGHDDTTRLLSVFATVGRAGPDTAPATPSASGPAGPCGSGCACYPN
jgi:putative FmdB family regulatory protein